MSGGSKDLMKYLKLRIFVICSFQTITQTSSINLTYSSYHVINSRSRIQSEYCVEALLQLYHFGLDLPSMQYFKISVQ